MNIFNDENSSKNHVVSVVKFQVASGQISKMAELLHAIVYAKYDVGVELLDSDPRLVTAAAVSLSFRQAVTTHLNSDREVTNHHSLCLMDVTALHCAAAVGNHRFVAELLHRGADPTQTFSSFYVWVNKADLATSKDIIIKSGLALHIAIFLNDFLTVKVLTSLSVYTSAVRDALTNSLEYDAKIMTFYLFHQAEYIRVDSQFELRQGSALHLSALLASRGMIFTVIPRYLQIETMKLRAIVDEKPFEYFKDLTGLFDDDACLNEIELGYTLHLAMVVRAPKVLRTLVEFKDLYEILLYSLFHRFLILKQLIEENIKLDIEKVNQYIDILSDKNKLQDMWKKFVIPNARFAWDRITEDYTFDSQQLEMNFKFNANEEIRHQISPFLKNYDVLKSSAVSKQLKQNIDVEREIGFVLLRLNYHDNEMTYYRKPLDYAVLIDDVEMAKILLNYGAKCFYIQNFWKMQDNEIIRAIMGTPYWEDYFIDQCEPHAVFLQEPPLALAIMDGWTEVKRPTVYEDPSGKFNKVTFIFDLFDSELRDPKKPGAKHPILTMVRRDQTELLTHPFIKKYVAHIYPPIFFIYMVLIAMYLVFAILFSGHLVEVSMVKELDNKLFKQCHMFKNVSLHEIHPDQFWTTDVMLILRVYVFVYIFMEVLELIMQGLDYFSIGNITDWTVYIGLLTLSFTHSELDKCHYYSIWQWEIAAIIVFLIWFKFFLYLRIMPVIGVFVVMFTEVLKNSLKFIVIFIVLLVCFAIEFHVLLGNQTRFRDLDSALIKTFVMAVGELTYEEIFLEAKDVNNAQDYDKLVMFPGLVIFFVIFIIVMSIVTMNLLVGIAVDDIAQIQRKARVSRLLMQAESSITILTRLFEFWRHFERLKNKLHGNSRRQALFAIFLILCIPFTAILIVFILTMNMLCWTMRFQNHRELWLRHYLQLPDLPACSWLHDLFLGRDDQDQLQEDINNMLFRKRNFKYYPEETDRDDEQLEELNHVQLQLEALNLKLDQLMKQFQTLPIATSSTSAQSKVNTAPQNTPEHESKLTAQMSLSGVTAALSVERALTRLVPRGEITSDLELEQEEKNIITLADAPFNRFRQVTVNQKQKLNKIFHDMGLADGKEEDNGSIRNADSFDEVLQHEMNTQNDDKSSTEQKLFSWPTVVTMLLTKSKQKSSND